MQQETREGLRFLLADGKLEDSPCELVNIQASHAESVLELQKTRNLLLLEHQITKDLQVCTAFKCICELLPSVSESGWISHKFLYILPGDYVLRDPAGGPRGMVRVMMKWKYPFQPPVDALLGRQGSRMNVQGRARESSEREERRREKDDASQRPIAKPRVKVRKVHDISAAEDTEAPESSESSSSQSDIVVIPPKQKMRKVTGEKLRVEILSLTFEPSSNVAMDKSVQRVYVEYRLLGIPMETTETPMSLCKPTKGEEIHYNFTRVIYVDGSQSTPLRQYLYTMLEGTDPNQGRLRFTVVSEPMDINEECVDVGHAFLNLQELLLTGNDVIEQQLDIVSVDEDEVIGSLKVSLEAAKALTGIYQEFHEEDKTEKDEKTDEEEEEEEEEEGKEKKKDQLQVIDYDDNSDFY
uniref:RPGRIP1 C-terminal domain-containing protein n=1 Tax=Neolamprologus brichardi TaxID=32507 RepID=A0A3Q4GT27_NEOBR